MLKTVYTVGDFISWQKNKVLELSPSFQRRPVWSVGAKSYLLDTIIRGLPIPIIFLREKKTDLNKLATIREVVDGQQRIRTIISFVAPEILKDFNADRDTFQIQKTHNNEVCGKNYDELPDEIKQKILDYQFSVHVLPSNIDDREVLQIFARMNATGVKLNDQELRNAQYYGEFKTSCFNMAAEQLPRWRKWGIFTENNFARMNEVELTSEFALLMLKGITGKTQSAINTVYGDKDEEFKERDEIERRFEFVMEAIDEKLGDEIKFSPFKKKTLFYCLFAVIYDAAFTLKSPLDKKIKANTISDALVTKIKVAGDRIQNNTAPDFVLEATSRRTTHPGSRTTIVNYLK